jgi:hypothetical protein
MSYYIMGWMYDFVDCGKEGKTEPLLSINLIFGVKLEKTVVTQFIVEHLISSCGIPLFHGSII